MKRNIYHSLLTWKKSTSRKPLILQGARQVGKTHILKDFGEKEFAQVHYFNWEKDQSLHKIFDKNLDPHRIINELSISSDREISIKEDLIFFDEIQECPAALSSLKYFNENIPEAPIVSAGSLLGVKLSPRSFPVGKVNFLSLYPMNFKEFLMGVAEDKLITYLSDSFEKSTLYTAFSPIAHQKLWDNLVDYFMVGGMPQVVQTFIRLKAKKHSAFKAVREEQKAILKSYQSDFSKHSGKVNSMHISTIFENAATQLSSYLKSTTQKYKFKDVIPGKKGFNPLEGPIHWLEKSGLIIKTKVCNRAEIPLKAFTKNNFFKLYYLDIGLLGAALDLPAKAIMEQQYGMTKGYLAENFVATELQAAGIEEIYTWAEKTSEIEFIQYLEDQIIPIEVKAGLRTKAKSLQQYILKYNPTWSIILSAKEPLKLDKKLYLPLYLAGELMHCLK